MCLPDTTINELTMSSGCDLLDTLELLRLMPLPAFRLGAAVAQLLSHIPGLVWQHLDHPVGSHSPVVDQVGFPAFVGAINQLIVRIRRRHGTHSALPTWHTSDYTERHRQFNYVGSMNVTI